MTTFFKKHLRGAVKLGLASVLILLASFSINQIVKAVVCTANECTDTIYTGNSVPTGVDGVVIAAPTASVAAGTYTSNQSVTLSASGSSSIHYTTSGTDPTCSTGTTYSSAISVSSTQTIEAISCYPNSQTSTVSSFAYTLSCPTVANAATYNAYPTCGPATCSSGYTVSGSTCVSSGSSSGGGGGSSTTVTPVVTTVPIVTTLVGAHPNGTLVLDGKTVYLIKDGKRLGFRNPDEYKSHGYSFGQAVAANAQDKAIPQAEFVQKALEGTLVLDASDNRTVYMIGINGVKRGFTSMAVFTGLGYNLSGVPKINLSDYPTGAPIGSVSESHPEGALVKEGQTIWWIRGGQKTGFESMQVFNTYGFSLGDVTKANSSDIALPQGLLVKFRDGTLVKDGNIYYLISDGKARAFASESSLVSWGYKAANAILATLSAYQKGEAIP